MARLGRALLAYTALVFALRAWHRGAWALYGLLWGCNQALLLAAYGLLADRPVLVGGALAVVATDQLLWYVDAAGRALLGRWPVGVASYLEARATPLERATSLHHLWFMPALAWALAHGKEAVAAADGRRLADAPGVPPGSWALSAGVTALLAVLARACTPFALRLARRAEDRGGAAATKEATKTGGQGQGGDDGAKVEYLNCNLSYAFWKDVPAPPLRALDHAPAWLYVPWIIVLCNALNVVPFLVVRALAGAMAPR